MDPFEVGIPTYTHSGTLETGEGGVDVGKPINWIELEFYNTNTDPLYATDWYIRSMEITAPDPVGVPGDFNEDDTVDAADYAMWAKLGNTPLPNDEGAATPEARYAVWAANFGATAGSGGGANSSVPEPGTFVYLVAAAGSLLWYRRRTSVFPE
jgi:hypothetical protein